MYDKSRILYGLNWAKKAVVETGRVVMCEGYTDVIGLQRAGIREAVATCGTALADGHIRLLKNFARRIVLAYDADAAGQAAAERFYEWERRFEVDIRVAALPPGSRPGRPGPQDPAALARAVDDARPFLGFRLERLFARADLRPPEGRARAAAEAMAMVGEHPNELVRDQYLMQVADRCRVEPARYVSSRRRPGGPAARSGHPPWRGLATAARRRSLPERTDTGRGRRYRTGGAASGGPPTRGRWPTGWSWCCSPIRWPGPASRRCRAATTLHEAIEAADPQAADLLQRLAVEEYGGRAPTTVMVRLVERAGQRALRDLQAEMRQATPAEYAGFAPTVAWLKLTLETLRTEDAAGGDAAVEAGRRLVDWLVARDAAEPTTEARR